MKVWIDQDLKEIEEIEMKIEKLRIGDTGPAGGIVFINPTTRGNTTGLWFEAGPCRNPDIAMTWSTRYDDSGTSATAIGSGASNTKIIAAMPGNTKDNCAAAYCASYSWNGFSDWFLPSDEELVQLHLQRDKVGGFPNDVTGYWSSTQGRPGMDGVYGGAHVQIMAPNGASGYNVGKDTLHSVRVVRAFSPFK